MQDVVTLLGVSMTGIWSWRSWMVVFGVAAALCTVSRTWADQDDDDDTDQNGAARPSIKQYDSRLPPVLPGERVVTEQGQQMNVWSSAGPVPVNPQPTPQTLQGLGQGGAIIVDGRIPRYGGYPGDGQGGDMPRIPRDRR